MRPIIFDASSGRSHASNLHTIAQGVKSSQGLLEEHLSLTVLLDGRYYPTEVSFRISAITVHALEQKMESRYNCYLDDKIREIDLPVYLHDRNDSGYLLKDPFLVQEIFPGPYARERSSHVFCQLRSLHTRNLSTGRG